MNRSKQVNNTSGISGVNLCKPGNRWRVYITLKHKTYNLGHYAKFTEAASVRMRAEELLYSGNGPQKTLYQLYPYSKEVGSCQSIEELCQLVQKPIYKG